ncbi:hypothetical protein ACVW0Y_001045 [Pseudomonas sp. TE3786]
MGFLISSGDRWCQTAGQLLAADTHSSDSSAKEMSAAILQEPGIAEEALSNISA